ncbi:hypothetical protein [Methanobrevibacter sp.]|uniref:hypothetical protein n=1 Tax=Methanobrevibacter sp. TaxID=66852 RepID=UPI003974EA5F
MFFVECSYFFSVSTIILSAYNNSPLVVVEVVLCVIIKDFITTSVSGVVGSGVVISDCACCRVSVGFLGVGFTFYDFNGFFQF